MSTDQSAVSWFLQGFVDLRHCFVEEWTVASDPVTGDAAWWRTLFIPLEVFDQEFQCTLLPCQSSHSSPSSACSSADFCRES